MPAAGCRHSAFFIRQSSVPFTYFGHTGDIGVDVEAGTLDGLFADAAAALTRTITEAEDIQGSDHRSLELSATDLDLLLVDWLSELLFRFETEGFLAAEVRPRVVRDEAWRLHAEISGEPAAALRVPIKVLVKAVTYHALEVKEIGAGWRARIIFDI